MDKVYKTIDLITPLVKNAGATNLINLFSQINSEVEFNQIYYELKDSSYFDVPDCGIKDGINLWIRPNSNTYKYSFYEEFLNQSNPLKMIVENKYEFHNSQIGAVGENAVSTFNTFQQNNSSISNTINIEELQAQLAFLRENLLSKAKLPEDYIAIGKVAAAEKAFSEKDEKSALKHLKDSGKWVFDTAKEILVGVVVELINSTITK